ncbi:GNAT family N-acetyltransferase [Williamsia sp. MIQD14]|uniref:GNAT family N-acetyltransferase n=1 Tax=Williamsia sp. MIQD14 TaxID=3425703 RepID=UPI003DA076AD
MTDPVEEWTRLARRVGARFTDGPTYAAAAATLHRTTPHTVAVHRGDDLVAVTAFAARPLGRVTLARSIGHGLGQGGDVIAVDDPAADALAADLARSRHVLRLEQFPADSPLLDALARDRRWHVHTRVVSEIPTLTLRPDATARDVRSGRTLGQLRSARRKLAADGHEVAFELLRSTADLDRRWDDMRRVAGLRADSRPEWDAWLAGDRGTLVRTVLDGEAAAGRLRVLGITVGGEWVGHDIAVRCGTTWARYLTHFDPGHARLQPGHQLMVWIVDHHRDLGIDTVHHGRGSTPVKDAWSNHAIDAVDVWAVPDTVVGARGVLPILVAAGTARARARAGLRRLTRRAG